MLISENKYCAILQKIYGSYEKITFLKIYTVEPYQERPSLSRIYIAQIPR